VLRPPLQFVQDHPQPQHQAQETQPQDAPNNPNNDQQGKPIKDVKIPTELTQQRKAHAEKEGKDAAIEPSQADNQNEQ
ncbi:hypothetical protein RA266_28995, partial [Pseudomonas syringae pv. tagetis]|uniref:hypothetical protein n=1 Tax=Pseudomonas syringae group genomosp. 7 TaxID=251699 RepID=UPI0037705AF9